MAAEHLAPLGGGQLRPRPAVRRGPGTGAEFVDQRTDRTGDPGGVVEPRLEQLGEDPLGPPEELRVGRRHAPSRIVREAQPAQLGAIPGDVRLGGGPGVGPGADRVLLGRQPERVVTDGVQHVPAGHSQEPAQHIGTDVAQRVSDVQALARRVREHVQHVELVGRHVRRICRCQLPDRVGREERAVLVPVVLPVGLDPVRQGGGVPVRRDVVGDGGGVGTNGRRGRILAGGGHGALHSVGRRRGSAGTKNPSWFRRGSPHCHARRPRCGPGVSAAWEGAASPP